MFKMYLKILCVLFCINKCLSTKIYYDYLTETGRDLTPNVPLELYLMPSASENVEDFTPLRHKRALSSTPIPEVPADSVLHTQANVPGTLPNIAGFATNPTLADKFIKSSGGSQYTGVAKDKSKNPKKVTPDESNGKKLVTPYTSTPDGSSIKHGNEWDSFNNYSLLPSTKAFPSVTPSTVAATAAVTSPTPSTTTTTTTEDPGAPVQDISPGTLSFNNITQSTNDSHIYYNSTCNKDEKIAQSYWVNLDDNNSKTHEILSNAHRRAVTQKLSFDFPFYGHIVRNVTIATGGFVYTGDYVHSWLAATQYIAPLMANFDTSLTNNSFIRYSDNETKFTVQWENVRLQDKPDAGGFTFQATLFNTGDIVFVYKNIPVIAIDDEHHPVKVGLSDAYIMDKTIFFVRRKTIYEYHRVHFSHGDISNWTSIYLKALPTCLDYHDCDSCTTENLAQLPCSWCPSANRCSSGLDRYRQNWLESGCDRKTDGAIDQAHQCSSSKFPYMPHSDEVDHSAVDAVQLTTGSEVRKMTMSSVLLSLLSVACVIGLVAWGFYAYTNPMSSSGQILIRYRPSQWTLKRGEARYTAATIHM